jgi:hypothetical protein
MVDTVILHVGPHKTGTTALQEALAARAGTLAEHGVLYPATGRQSDSHAGLGEALLTGRLSTLADLVAEAADWRVVLISTEHLSAAGTEGLVALRAAFPGAEFRVSYTLRRLVTLWPSHWAELVKHGQRLSFQGYLDRVQAGDDRAFHAPILPFRHLDRLTQVFGEAALHVGLYEARQSAGQDVGPTLIDDLLGLGQIASVFATRRFNITAPEVVTAMVYLVNQQAGESLDYAAKQRLRLALLDRLRHMPHPVWFSALEAAVGKVERVVLTDSHPLIKAEQERVARRFGGLLQDAVEGYLAPVKVLVPRLEALRVDPGALEALAADCAILLAA